MSKSINIFGFHSVESLLRTNPESIIKVFIHINRKDKRANELVNTLTNQKITFSTTDKNDLDRIAKGEIHQGVISEVILPPLRSYHLYSHCRYHWTRRCFRSSRGYSQH